MLQLTKKITLSCKKTGVKCVPLSRTKISNNKNKACFLCYFHGQGFIFHMSHTHCPINAGRQVIFSSFLPWHHRWQAKETVIFFRGVKLLCKHGGKRDLSCSWEEGAECRIGASLFISFFFSPGIKIKILIGGLVRLRAVSFSACITEVHSTFQGSAAENRIILENRKFALGAQSDSVPVRTNFQLAFTSISHSTYVFLVTGEL